MNYGSVRQMISGESEIEARFDQEMSCALRWGFHYTRNRMRARPEFEIRASPTVHARRGRVFAAGGA